jgi:hypothetical protein
MTPTCVMENNIEMDFQGAGYDIVDGIYLAQVI